MIYIYMYIYIYIYIYTALSSMILEWNYQTFPVQKRHGFLSSHWVCLGGPFNWIFQLGLKGTAERDGIQNYYCINIRMGYKYNNMDTWKTTFVLTCIHLGYKTRWDYTSLVNEYLGGWCFSPLQCRWYTKFGSSFCPFICWEKRHWCRFRPLSNGHCRWKTWLAQSIL